MSNRIAPWQGDLHHHPELPQTWYLLVCTAQGQIVQEAIAPQAEVNAAWLAAQVAELPPPWPQTIQIFRPQTLGLWQTALQTLPLTVEPTRHTAALKLHLSQRWSAGVIQIPNPPPQPLPDGLWGKDWQLGSLVAEEIEIWRDRPIPICEIPERNHPLRLGLSSEQRLPGVVINGDRRAMQLARWLQDVRPVSMTYIPTEVGRSGGLVLAAGLDERWILATFEDAEMATAAAQYQSHCQAVGGLHFLLVQPDSSGMTYSGFWLLRAED
ncbi:MAG: Tab2 family RNA-binding protein [Cyanobacteria bacterium P01_G01_bin.54]